MTTENFVKAAKHIVEDRNGSDYYQDALLLAHYLEKTLEMPFEEALKKAKIIHDDRKGANYYQNIDILTNFLRQDGGQFHFIIDEILDLYTDSTLLVLLNDLVSIGTWPTPEQTHSEKPMSDKAVFLQKLIDKLLTVTENERLGNVIR